MYTTDQAINKATAILQNATLDSGIMALSEDLENYKRIWSRDSMIAGIAGLLINDSKLNLGLKNSILSLASMQHTTGAIPSNVNIDLTKASYGSLAGRVDATTWWLVGTALYIHNFKDENFEVVIKDHVLKAINVLDAWEFNGRDLIYTPLSGNWADEYPLHGYLLYDNLLRYWAIKMWAEMLTDKNLETKALRIKSSISKNFWPDPNESDHYHPKIKFDQSQQYFTAGFHPGNVYKVFDAAANGLAMMLGFSSEEKTSKIINYVKGIFAELGQDLVPAFWPVINEGDATYHELSTNFAYVFKNYPNHFHNGGIWPVMMGVFALGLTLENHSALTTQMFECAKSFLNNAEKPFAEYIDSANFQPGGKKELCFSAAGCIFMAQSNKAHIRQKLNINM